MSAEEEKIAAGDSTAFDTLADHMRREMKEGEEAKHGPDAMARLVAAFSAVLGEADDLREGVTEAMREEGQKISEQMKTHPAATISSAFAAGYLVGKSVTRKVRK